MHLREDRLPLHRQLAIRLVNAVLDGELREGEAIPSVRELAMQHVLNPNTVALAIASLEHQGVLDVRGEALYVQAGAREALRSAERERFLREEWPVLCARLDRLGINLEELAVAPAHKVA